jgi:hypothetical protein
MKAKRFAAPGFDNDKDDSLTRRLKVNRMQKISGSFLVIILVGAFSLCTVGSPLFSSSTSRTVVLSGVHASGSVSQDAGDGITKANWQRHPKITEVRAIVQSVKARMSRKSLTVRKRAFEYCEPYEDVARTIATDAKGRVRFYGNEGGSDDSALKWKYYYDEMGRLRFAFITGGAINGSKLEHRIYFDENGKRLWEDHTYKKGPGYTFPEVWPDEQLQIKNPAAQFSSTSPCEEIKSKLKM